MASQGELPVLQSAFGAGWTFSGIYNLTQARGQVLEHRKGRCGPTSIYRSLSAEIRVQCLPEGKGQHILYTTRAPVPRSKAAWRLHAVKFDAKVTTTTIGLWPAFEASGAVPLALQSAWLLGAKEGQLLGRPPQCC